MKTLLLLRHAKSDWSDPQLADHHRPLNKRGKRNARRMGRLLKEEHLVPDLILTSTAERAVKTVKTVVAQSGYRGEIRALDELYPGGSGVYVTIVRDLSDTYKRVMVVGHNPGLEGWLEQLTGTMTRLPTAALAQIGLPPGRWRELSEQTRGTLQHVWLPRELA
jgi:phosphohistidine phosphatase